MNADELWQLDVEIHTKVMGRECFLHNGSWCETDSVARDMSGKPFIVQIPVYSTDIAAAWLVVEELRQRMPYAFVDVIAMTSKHGKPLYSARVAAMDDEFTINLAHFYEDNAPLAICRAALKAVSPASVPTPTDAGEGAE